MKQYVKAGFYIGYKPDEMVACYTGEIAIPVFAVTDIKCGLYGARMTLYQLAHFGYLTNAYHYTGKKKGDTK